MKTFLAVACAAGAAVFLNFGLYLQKKAVDRLPAVRFEISWSVFKAFATDRPWMTSIAVTLLGGGLYAIAIAIAPVSIVQPVVASGVALLAYLAIKNLGERPRRIDLYAIGASILGVILIGVSLFEGVPDPGKLDHSPLLLWVFAGVAVLLAVAMPLLFRGSSGNRMAAGLGISVGLLFGMAAIFARLLLVDWGNQWASKGLAVVFSSVFLIAWAALLLPAVVMLQAALQRGMAVIVVPVVAGLGQLVPIVGGLVALREPLPDNAFLAAVRIFAFAMILGATIVLSYRVEESGTGVAPPARPTEAAPGG